MSMFRKVVPREYVDRLLSSKTEDFYFGATVETESGVARVSKEDLKGKRLVAVDNPMYKGLSASYTKLLNRLARIRGIDARFKAYIVPTDATETIKTSEGEFNVIFAVAEVYRETASGRRKVFHYGTIIDNGSTAMFNPFGVVNDEGLEATQIALSKAGLQKAFPLSPGRRLNNDVIEFIVLKLLNGKEWGAYFNFPVAFFRYSRGQPEGGIAYIRLDGNSTRMTLIGQSGMETKIPAFDVSVISYLNEVEEQKTPEGLKVRHFPTITAGGKYQFARFFVSKKNPDVVWLGKLVAMELENFVISHDEIKIDENPLFLIGTEKDLLTTTTVKMFERNGRLYVSEIVGIRKSGYAGNTFFTIKGYNPLRDPIGVVNARVPGIGIYIDGDFGAGVLFYGESDDGAWGTAKGVAVIVSKEGRMLMKKIKTEGQKYAY